METGLYQTCYCDGSCNEINVSTKGLYEELADFTGEVVMNIMFGEILLRFQPRGREMS